MIMNDSLIQEFFKEVASGRIEIYNEFSLQHEFGIYLRRTMPAGFKVQFERPISYFHIPTKLSKTEIDISIFRSPRSEMEAVEFKFPRAGRTPESMFDTCKDIQFVEELKSSGFVGGAAILVADNSDFYQPKQVTDGIYQYFRHGRTLTGQISKPTGDKNQYVNIQGSYEIHWHTVMGDLKYAALQVT